MIAVIIAPSRNPDFHGFDEHLSTALVPLVDRPFLQHVIEHLLCQNVRRFELILSHLPDQVEKYFGDGARWGCRFQYHLALAGRDPYAAIAAITESSKESVLLGKADFLPLLDLPAIKTAQENKPLIVCRKGSQGRKDGEWAGWALLPPGSCLLEFSTDKATGKIGVRGLGVEVTEVIAHDGISAESGEDLLSSQRRIFEGKIPNVVIGGRQLEPGVWVSRSVSLDPTACLKAPVYIGANCRIGAKAQIGPFAVVGNNCIVEDQTKVTDAVICPGTYVGEALNLDGAIVDRSRLFNVGIGTCFSATEAYLLSGLVEHGLFRMIRRLGDQAIAAFMLSALWPICGLTWLLLMVSRRGSLVHEHVVQTPADDNPINWRTYSLYRFQEKGRGKSLTLRGSKLQRSKLQGFLFEFVPGLFSVLQGHLSLVGVKARSATSIERLPHEWRTIYLRAKGGLITETEVVFGSNATEDESYTAEAYYGATESFGHDLKLLAKYVSNFGPRRPEILHEDALEESSHP